MRGFGQGPRPQRVGQREVHVGIDGREPHCGLMRLDRTVELASGLEDLAPGEETVGMIRVPGQNAVDDDRSRRQITAGDQSERVVERFAIRLVHAVTIGVDRRHDERRRWCRRRRGCQTGPI